MELTHRTLRVRRTAALVAATAAAALAIPAAANAAVTGAATGDTATLTGDDANDNIIITVSGANLRHNLPTTLAGPGFRSATDFDSTVDGEQTLTAAAGRLTIDGGGGDDIIVGGPNLDTIKGGEGDDRLTGGPNNAVKPVRESIQGGAGNDVMIWNNGDGDDIDDGGDGVDETQFNNGTADDVMDVAPVGGGAHHFHRVGANIEIDMTASTERLNINAFSGNDSLVSAPGTTVATTVDAGPGNDTITTGDGADLIQGGTGLDTLSGGAGADRIVGNQGNDTDNGGTGDDTLVWNNGDATDNLNGQDGLDRVEANMSGGVAGDAMTLKPAGAKVRFDRTNLVPFGLNIASSEVFELNGLGGDDTLTTAPGLGALISVVADGGPGNDAFTGGDESDTYFGGLGDDWLDPGAGIGDAVDGQAGNDTLKVRDGFADLARGGEGTDNATADREDVLVDVESADVPPAPPAADTTGTAARVTTKRVTSKLKKGVYTAKIRVSCPASEAGGCKGTLVLQTARTVSLGGTRFHAIVASKRYTLNSGQAKTLKVRLPKGVRAVSRRGTLSLNAITTNRDAAGNLAQRSSRLAVKLVR
jgi:Ca2+-binding RTX toxin-like protein